MVANTGKYSNLCVILLTLSSVTNAQLLPGLPDLPSAQPSISDVASLPSTSPPDLSPSPSVVPSSSPSGPIAIVPTPNVSPAGSPSISHDSPFPEISPIIEELQCVRDVHLPAPTLGTSQFSYALSVVLSAAAVALASLIYTASAASTKHINTSFAKNSDSEQRENDSDHDGMRVFGIIVARVLIAISIKVSAALVASIANSSPEDGALDASGAFLTWASAILTRTYYEAIQMTLRALGFIAGNKIWDRELREYLEPYNPTPDPDEESIQEQQSQSVGLLQDPCRKCEQCEKSKRRVTKGRTLYQLLFWPPKDRLALTIHAILYIISECATLFINLKDFVNTFSSDAARTLFVPGDEAGQCGIVKDLPLIIGLGVVQAIFLISQQQSLIPLLTIFAARSMRGTDKESDKKRKRRVVTLVLFFIAWIVSLFTLPLFYDRMYTIFVVGDISLFWQVIIGPPRYSDPSFGIAAAYAVITTIVFAFIAQNIFKRHKTTEPESEPDPGLSVVEGI